MMKRFVRPRPGARRTLPEMTEEPSSPYANELGDWRAAEQRREPQLVPAGKEDSGRRLEPPQAAGFLAVAARIEIHHRHPRGAQVREEFLVPGPRLVHPTGCGDDDDIRVGAARDAYEAFQNMAVVLLVFGAADRHDPAATLARGNFTWHSAAPPRAPKWHIRALRFNGLRQGD